MRFQSAILDVDTFRQYLETYSQISEEKALDIFLQIYDGFQGITKQKKQNIKPFNIMFKLSKIKIIDFGFCKKLSSLNSLNCYTQCGIIGYQAPEVKDGNQNPQKSDIYSLGVFYYEILYGLQNIQDFTFHSNIKDSEEMKIIIQMMLQKDSKNRVSFQQLGNILKAINNTFGKISILKLNLSLIEENLKQKFLLLQTILQQCKTFRQQNQDFTTQSLELLLIKKIIQQLEEKKVQFKQILNKIQLKKSIMFSKSSQHLQPFLMKHLSKQSFQKLISYQLKIQYMTLKMLRMNQTYYIQNQNNQYMIYIQEIINIYAKNNNLVNKILECLENLYKDTLFCQE